MQATMDEKRMAALYRRYVEALNRCSLLAQRDFAKVWARASKLPPKECRNVLVALVPGITEKYGNMASIIAAQYYESVRAACGGNPDYHAEMSENVPIEQVEASVRFAAGHLEWSEHGADAESDGSLFGGED